MQPAVSAPASGASAVCPLTAAEFLEGLRDGPEVWIHGERVRDVFTTATDTGDGSFAHTLFKLPRISEELAAARDAVAARHGANARQQTDLRALARGQSAFAGAAPYLDRYGSGAGGRSAQDRIKPMKLVWDSLASEESAACTALVDRSLSEYGLDGWGRPGSIDSDDVSLIAPARKH